MKKQKIWNKVRWTNVYWGEQKKLNVYLEETRASNTCCWCLCRQTNLWTSRPTKRVFWMDTEFSVSTFRPHAQWVPLNNFVIPESNSCVHLTMEVLRYNQTPRSESGGSGMWGPPTVSLRERVSVTNGKRRRWQLRDNNLLRYRVIVLILL